MAAFIFIISLFMVVYVYLGYPCLIYLIALIRNKRVQPDAYQPTVTILIAAYNEEDCIKNTLENKLIADYPKDKLEIIVISDESTDNTDAIVRQFEPRNVKLLRQVPRAGKTSALNQAIHQAAGDIIVFSDANSIYDPSAIKNLVRNFSDQTVGYVTGKMIYTHPDGSTIGDGCSTYMKYENWLRKYETRFNSIVGVDGGIDAVRKALYQPMHPDQLPDFVLPLKVIEQGYRVIYEPEAILKEPSLKAQKDEYKMRVRVSLRALWALRDMRHLLSFKVNPLFAWQLWSHKVLRYTCFIFLLTALIANILLWSHMAIYKLCLGCQFLLYVGALLSPVLKTKPLLSKILLLLNYFVLLNVASAHAFLKFILGQKVVIWTPRKG